MSDPHAHAQDGTPHDDGPHEGPIRTPKQLVVAVVASFLVPIIVIIMLVNFVDMGAKPGAGSDGLEAEAVGKRLQRVGSIVIKDPANAGPARGGEDVFKGQCAACHATGAAGAPKLGDAAAWGPRVKNGFDALLTSALKGKGAMAPQGGGEFSAYEIGRAVVYMANQGGAKFAEPPAPAASAASAP
ncbi:c-type cytochrome [Rubrivivax sp. A210]|uniref:c-type cytochrome n=1 Tax=Rubrivivax sp. A210 TaxID=2772301 RepID=UPI001918F508|nr:c-type cytochrome [Rubrivivax sp. A210]